MNEIKFRVWDINEEEYCDKYYHNGFLIATDGTLIMYDSRTRKYLGVNGDYIIELYTGLKDKKGVEIYENDNIKDDYSNEVATVISGKIGYDGVWKGEPTHYKNS